MLKVVGHDRLTAHARGRGARLGMEQEGRGRRAVSGGAHRACVHRSNCGDGMFCCLFGLRIGQAWRW